VKVLLDESCPAQLRAHLAHHETFTAVYAGFGGCKNGTLLKAAEAAGFEVLVTADKTLEYEQNLTGRNLALVCLSANSWRVIAPHARMIVAAVDAAAPGSFRRVECGTFTRREPMGPEPCRAHRPAAVRRMTDAFRPTATNSRFLAAARITQVMGRFCCSSDKTVVDLRALGHAHGALRGCFRMRG